MASDSGADAELRERVAALEETVAEQHHSSESPEQPTASRRGLLSGAAAAAGLGALGIYSSSRASAQAAGQLGTQSNPVDVEAYDLNVQGSVSGIDTGGVENPLTETLDAGGNDLTNVGVSDTGSVSETTITVPGDYSTVAQALQTIKRRRSPPGQRYFIEIQDGHELQEPVDLPQAELAHVNVQQANDNAVPLASGFPTGTPAVTLDKGSVIRWQAALDGGGHDDYGYLVKEGSMLLGSTPTGANDFTRGIQVEKGFVFGSNMDFNDNSERGLSIVRGSLAQVQLVTARNNGDFNVRVGGNSVVQVTDADLTDSNQDGLRANNGSAVYCEGTNVSGAARHGLSIANNARVSGYGGDPITADNCGGDALDIGHAYVDLRGLSCDSAGGSAVRIEGGALVDLRGASIANATGFGLFCEGGRVNASDITISGAGARGVVLRNMASANVADGSVTNSSGDDIEVGSGSFVAADGCVTSSSTGGDPHQNDVNKAFNQVSGSGIPMAESFET